MKLKSLHTLMEGLRYATRDRVFLDIGCCFKGYDLKEVKDILCAHHGQCIEYHIGGLVAKTLIKIIHLGPHVVVTLHDLIEDMGKEIVRQESLKEPGKRSRLWFYEDTVQVLERKSFPPLKLTSLEALELSYYKSLERFPEILRPFTIVKNIQQHSTPTFSIPNTPHHFLSLIQHSFNFYPLQWFFIQHSTPPPFISYFYLILYFCFYNYIKLQLSIIIKLKY